MASMGRLVLALMVILTCQDKPAVHSFKLTILHTNDVHGAVEPVNEMGSRCKSKGHCYGGALRVKALVDEIRATDENVILLDSGNFYDGTFWTFHYGGAVMAQMMSMIGYDAAAFGNHEFERGPEGVLSILDKASFPVLSANLNTSQAPQLGNRVKKYAVVEVGGEKIGLIGFTTVDTTILSNPGNLTFEDVVTSVQKASDELRAAGVRIIIAMGRLKVDEEEELASRVKGLDVIIGGHKGGFQYTGKPPTGNFPTIPYPDVIEGADNSKVLLVQTVPKYRYLGLLQIVFNDDDTVATWSGNPVLLDNSIENAHPTPEYTALGATIQRLAVELNALRSEKVGETLVDLDATRKRCRLMECNIGNLVADGMLDFDRDQYANTIWKDVNIAMVHSGGIRNSIEKGDIDVEQVFNVLPHSTTIVFVEITGQTIFDALVYSSSKWHLPPNALFGGFFQVSGMKIVFDMSRKIYERVTSVEVLCSGCQTPDYEPLVMDKSYKVALSGFIWHGGEGFSMIYENIIRRHDTGIVEADFLRQHIMATSPITIGLEDRITIKGHEIFLAEF